MPSDDQQPDDLVRIVEDRVLSDAWGTLRATTFQLRRRSGDWQTQVRETYDKGDGAVVLLYSRTRGTVLLTRQFRYPAFANGDAALMIEAPAGLLDGDTPETCIRREAEEEAGYRLGRTDFVQVMYPTPGCVLERVHLFTAPLDDAERISEGGGLVEEGEDIEVFELDFDEALAMVRAGDIVDAKTVILLQHAALEKLIA